ncbi:hypothetical protein BsIDN1_12730 [Bacillus safensis]|uniref:Asn/Gln amidotransferase domain-containing protein n=1 Tax=Bacillus safensis TaxID=561879 RepID=A0A5S9M4C8_BACIA|nr:hypothetical protein BsIDN1_12730 [Bacillus safensis]
MVLTLTKEMSDFFEATISEGAEVKQASNWLMGEVSAYLNSAQKRAGRYKANAARTCWHDQAY